MISSKHISFILFFIASFSFSQTPNELTSIKSAEYDEAIKTSQIIAFHTTKSGYSGIISKAKKKMLFNIFDQDLNKIYTSIIDFPKKETFIGSILYGNEIKLFTEYIAKKNNRVLYCYNLGISPFSNNKTLVNETAVNRNLLYSEMSEHQIKLDVSPNGNYTGIISDNIAKKENSFSIGLYDSKTLNQIFHKKLVEYPGQYFELKYLVVDEMATIYSLGKLYLKGRREKINGVANYKYVLNVTSKNENKTLTIDLEDLHIETLSISLKENQIHLLGLYSERSSSSVKGVCNFRIEKESLTLIDKYTKQVKLNVLNGSKFLSFSKKDKEELSNFNLDYTLQDENGNTYLLAEKFYITSTPATNFSPGTTTYNYDDIIIFKFNDSGFLEWGESIFKRAHEHSYNAFVKNDELHVIVNSGKNLEKNKDGRIKISKGLLEKQSLYDIVFSKDGQINHNKLLNYEQGYKYQPNLGSYKNDKFIMPSNKRSRKHFIILK